MKANIESLLSQFSADIANVKSTADLESLRVKYLGKKGPIQQLMQLLKDVSPEERPAVGKKINELKDEISATLESYQSELVAEEERLRLLQEKIDITLPGRQRFPGRTHVLTKTIDDVIEILSGMGFTVQYGPDIDSEYYNFEALNFPADHPARDMQDTFYLSSNMLLRTQTSNIQVRVMERQKPPIRIIAPGKVYRNETITARSHVFFHQVEALYIDKNVTFADLFGTLREFVEKFFEREVPVRYRPSYFPFVEPGMEIDIQCTQCEGEGCSLCKHSGWLEIAGAGMVHPEVMKSGGIDPELYTGYAWGMGMERLAMLRYGITDIRMFTENDLRFLAQFK